MTRLERLTGSSAIIIPVAIGSEVQEFLLAISTPLHHLLLTRPIRWDRAVARHLGLVSHNYFFFFLDPIGIFNEAPTL
jgi:hypothetical protein